MKKIQQPSPFTKGRKRRSSSSSSSSSSGGGSALSSPGSVQKYEDMYMNMDLSQNPYAGLQNTMEGMTNQYANATNIRYITR